MPAGKIFRAGRIEKFGDALKVLARSFFFYHGFTAL